MSLENINKIKDIAESKIKEGGFNAFSFREIAKEIGIKSASVHYYFPTKSDLAIAVVERYIERFTVLLEEIDESCVGEEKINKYIDLFISVLTVDQRMCLCGILGTESQLLPESVKASVGQFFELNICWLTNVYKGITPELNDKAAREKAIKLNALLQGSLLLGQVLDSKDEVVSALFV